MSFASRLLVASVPFLAVAPLACGGDDAAPPAKVTITSPTAGATLSLGATKRSSVVFTVENFMLAATCSAAGCGHAHLNIDGMACNDPAMSSPYNSMSATTTIEAKFDLCPATTQVGPHTLTVSLHDPMHEDILAAGKPVKSEVMITTTM